MISRTSKERVEAYWNAGSCGSDTAEAEKFSRPYFEQIEDYRYRHESQIHAFAQFTRHHGQKVLEVGVGAATDFLQWVRAGARAHGIDLTEEAVEHARRRLAVYGLEAEEVRVADAENLPFPDDTFDLVYSWGVIHHSPDPMRALREIVRCTRPGGEVKVMVYNRRSLYAFYQWLRFGPLRGRPFRSVADVLYQHVESYGTQAYTLSEIQAEVAKLPVRPLRIAAPATGFYDLLNTRSKLFQGPAYVLACLRGFGRCGWFLEIHLRKEEPRSSS